MSVGTTSAPADVAGDDGSGGNTDEGLWDDAMGSVDEAWARQFDDTEGGGLVDGAAGNDVLRNAAASALFPGLGTAVGAGAELANNDETREAIADDLDHAAGSVDESVARQFDDTPGGGFADLDTWQSAADDAQEAATDASSVILPDLTAKQRAVLVVVGVLVLATILRPYMSAANSGAEVLS